MEISRLELGDDLLWGYRSDSLDEYLTTMRMSTVLAPRPEELRVIIDVVIAQFGRVSQGDFMDGHLTFPDHVVAQRGSDYIAKRFQKFEKNMRLLSEWSVKSRGRHWAAVLEAVEQGADPLKATIEVIQQNTMN